LRELGYSNHIEVLNAKNYGIPQNRERAFMVSILGNYQYKFPKAIPLTLRLKDMLEKEVDEKYYISKELMGYFTNEGTGKYPRRERFIQNIGRENQDIANAVTTLPGQRPVDNFVGDTKEYANYLTWEDSKGRLNTQDHRAYFEDRLSGTIPAMERGVPNVLLKEDPTFVKKKYEDFYNKNGYIPELFNPYNEVEITNIAPTMTTQSGSLTSSSSVLVKEQLKVDVIANIRHNGTSQSGNVYDKEQLSPTLCATDYKNPPKITEPKVNVVGNYSPSNHNASSIVDSNGLAPTVMENHGTITATQHNLRIRKLTPKECYRLMGFGDQAFDLAAPNQSNSSLYHQAGDSIVVNVLMELFRSLI